MAIFTNVYGDGHTPDYEGCVLDWYEHNGYDDSDWYAICWNEEKQTIDKVLFNTTRCACSGRAEIDATPEVLRKVYHFLGSINFHGDQRKKVIAGKEGVYEELLDQMVYNFGCDFAVPTPDKKLEELIRAWNGDERLPKRLVDVEAMTGRVEQLGGLNLIWY